MPVSRLLNAVKSRDFDLAEVELRKVESRASALRTLASTSADKSGNLERVRWASKLCCCKLIVLLSIFVGLFFYIWFNFSFKYSSVVLGQFPCLFFFLLPRRVRVSAGEIEKLTPLILQATRDFRDNPRDLVTVERLQTIGREWASKVHVLSGAVDEIVMPWSAAASKLALAATSGDAEELKKQVGWLHALITSFLNL